MEIVFDTSEIAPVPKPETNGNAAGEDDNDDDHDREDDDDEDEEEESTLAEFVPYAPGKPAQKSARPKRRTASIEPAAQSTPHDSTKKKNFGCPLCSQCFETRLKYVQHSNEYHNVNPKGIKICVCPKCLKKFMGTENLKVHAKNCTGALWPKKPFSCSHCSEQFEYLSDFKKHQATVHNMEKPFSCTMCNAKFTRKGQIKNHMRIHTQEQPYACKECGKKFSKKTNMLRHLVTHDEAKKFSCTICEKSFKWETSLAVHLNTHTGDRPFKCERADCVKSYTSLSGLKKHISWHNGEEPNDGPPSGSPKKSPKVGRQSKLKAERRSK